MKDSTLRDLLGKLAVPPLDEAAAERARYRAATAFAHRSAGPIGKPAPLWRRKLAYGLVLATLLAIAYWAVPARHTRQNTDAQLLAEMEKLFPGQLDGVICSNGNVDLDIAPEATLPNRVQALALTLRRGKQIVRVLGYSGRKVCVNLGGHRHCLEPLVTGEGTVIVAGDDFVWTGTRSAPVAGYRLEARILSL